MTRALALLAVLLLVAAFLAITSREPEQTVDATAPVTTTTAWPQETVASLPIGFSPERVERLVHPPKPPVRARTAPRAVRHAQTAAGAIPDLIRSVFSRFGAAVAEQAVRVSGCETGHTWNPAVVNSSGHTGLFQLSPRYHTARAQRLGFTWAQMREALPNITVAADIYAESKWGPWTCKTAA